LTNGTCSREIQFLIDDGVIVDCIIIGGCRGNTQGVSRLVKGRKVDEVISLLEGIECQNGTSCPDQVAKALKKFKESNF